MTRDYSALTPAAAMPPKREIPVLQRLGWQAFFAQQISVDEMEATPPVRVTEVHRSGLRVLGDGIDEMVPPRADATVGDWLLFNRVLPSSSQLLERKSLIKRRAAGHDRSIQLIAANLDTAFVVTSCNLDFNMARLERYIALAFDAGVTPVVLLTKSDLCADPAIYVDQAQTISKDVAVITLNAKSDEPRERLAPWCKPGQTVAFLGSSGVGKSTLTNALSGTESAATQAIREDDAKGRHTTSHRQLHILPDGCAVLDTPGVRELQLTDAEAGVAEVFSDLDELAALCRFNDCRHVSEPGCAVQAALKAGTIDEARLARWRKLLAEDQFNTASLAQRRSKDKAFGKMVRQAKKLKTP
ncbi:MAG: ribosome small subunit-dependent GTPase A [Hoeflea sp.]|uniref:ribosome small subunit-dependent GTPase A n=1 Tax=Hoeflea sp. TaxID=1940281 RepID=UPI00272F059B|nr:ribosome small subunit-dependent GTPase A [Hoeflea sp.]MDP2121615.1 ribosome small subunit-dependent GTPase A [Hoeflea sp.]MDP3524678.1 ribosome small subunit-dependent GTPase A [Hoeflea sp.]